MFEFLKKKSKKEKLMNRYEDLMAESFRLSKINRKQSDEKYEEAQLVDREISQL